MQDYGNRYPHAGYGGMFRTWLREDEPKPYNSFGNGSAMRVSPVGWAFDTLGKTLEAAKESAEVTHNHPEGIKGAQATAACIFLARTGKSKEEIKDYIENTWYANNMTDYTSMLESSAGYCNDRTTYYDDGDHTPLR